MGPIGVITNPKAKKNVKEKDIREKLQNIVGDDGIVRETPLPDRVNTVAEEFKKNNISLLCINGGDGSISITLRSFLDVYQDTPLPPIVHLRGGTMNTVANDIYSRGNNKKMLARVVEMVRNQEEMEIIERDLMRVNKFCGFMFGVGLGPRFMEVYYEGGNPSPQKATRIVLQGIGSVIAGTRFAKDLFIPFKGCVRIDGEELSKKEFLYLFVYTVETIGLLFRPFYRALEKQGHSHIWGGTMPPLSIILNLPKLFRGKPVNRSDLVNLLGREIVLSSDREILYYLDGEVHKSFEDIRITTGPRIKIVKVV